MTLELKNIGMIKEASVKIDGLTVIAGENDTGKSTVGKALFFLIESNKIYKPRKKEALDRYIDGNEKDFAENFGEDFDSYRYEVLRFDFSYIGIGNIYLDYKNVKFNFSKNFFERAIFIETPYVMDLENLFSQMNILESGYNSGFMSMDEIIILDYPYTLRDLYKKLRLPIKNKSPKKLLKNLDKIMNGKIEYQRGFKFLKKGLEQVDIEIRKTATGIKSFGILQILIENNYLNKDSILIIDEPEVHLHPKWQLKYAKFIVELVKNGVKVLVTSHSPYMIQALIKYARDNNIVDKSNFYLTKRDGDYATIDNVNDELNKIFELLAEPMNEVYE